MTDLDSKIRKATQRKITAATVRALAEVAARRSGGRIGLVECHPDTLSPVYVGTTQRWTGPDANRRAAAYYAGAVDGLFGNFDAPWARDVVATLGERYAAHVKAGRDCATALIAAE